MGDFFARQELARRRTRWLVLLFLAAVAAIVGAVALLMYLLFAGDLPPGELRALLGGSALATLLVIAVASLVKIASLRSGGPAVALSVGAVPVDPTTQDPRLRRLINTVEEMAIASGSPVPAIFVLEGEEGINAFAAGYGPGDAAVAVTRGALERLTRDELQGVIAHEFSHIAHGDMRLNVRLIGLLAGILAVAAIGRAMVRGASRSSGSGRRNGGNAFLVLVIGASLWLIGSIGQFFGRLIKAAVSRQREFLADASAVQFTRQPAGILGALVKIAAAPRQARLQDGGAEELSHMLFGDGFGLRGLFATHPPLESRIRAIDPRFDAERIAKLSAQLPAVGAAWDELPALGLAAAPAEAPAAEGSAQPRADRHRSRAAARAGRADRRPGDRRGPPPARADSAGAEAGGTPAGRGAPRRPGPYRGPQRPGPARRAAGRRRRPAAWCRAAPRAAARGGGDAPSPPAPAARDARPRPPALAAARPRGRAARADG
ncbi:MAG: M48 family metallopeptidase [Xanthomonadales bacterium]|nr:M48 family metallopeptidase [Xanthomonadales bacterium]